MSTSYPIVATQSTYEVSPSPFFLKRERGAEGGVRVRRAALAMRELVPESIHVEMVTAFSGDHLGA